MRTRTWASIVFFLSAYSPLCIVFLFQDIDYSKGWEVRHPALVWAFVGLSMVSCIILVASIRAIKASFPPVLIKKVSNRSGELINYSIPYMLSFFVMDLGDAGVLLGFAFFMLLMYVLTVKTHNIFVNPVLACFGYNLYDVTYERDGQEYEEFFLIKGARLRPGDRCRCVELSEQLSLVTDRNPEV